LGEAAFLIVSHTPFIKILPDIRQKMDKAVRLTAERFSGECSDEEITRLYKLACDAKADIIIGMGGGKTLDTAKAVASRLKKPVIIIPTVASSDAPCSALSVVYTPAGEFKRVVTHPFNPDVVLVDTGLIIQAPVRFLVAGMGDALSTYFEAESCRVKPANNTSGYRGTATAYDLARLCYKNLLSDGIQAKIDAEAHRITPTFERIVETNTLLSGIGFESGGLAAAHAIHNGLLILKEARRFLHGELVAFGTLASLFLTQKPQDIIERTYAFCGSVGLPTTLSEIGLRDASDEEILAVAKSSCTDNIIFNESVPVTAKSVSAAIKKASLFGNERKSTR